MLCARQELEREGGGAACGRIKEGSREVSFFYYILYFYWEVTCRQGAVPYPIMSPEI